jgi:hypothetical protein
MKKLLSTLLMALALAGSAQNAVKLENGVYVSQTVKRAKIEAKETGKQYKDSKGKLYPILLSENGKYFVNKVSQKTGKAYKMYITL